MSGNADSSQPTKTIGISQQSYLCLKSLYDQAGDSIDKHIHCGNLTAGVDGASANDYVVDYLVDKGYVEPGSALTVKITHWGIRESENIILNRTLAVCLFGGYSEDAAQLVLRRQERRYSLLRKLYDIAAAARSFSTLYQHKRVTEGVEISEEEWQAVCDYLDAEGLADLRVNTLIGITPSGIDEIEQTISMPDSPTAHFSVQVIQNFYGNVGIVQIGSHNTAYISDET
jgi:hypothetical protein